MKCCFALHAVTNRTDTYQQLNKHQISVLETSFTVQCFLDKIRVKELALETGLSEKKVFQWFQSTRRNTRVRKYEGALSICEFLYILVLGALFAIGINM